ncbi:MAG: hypothetical protein JSS02_06565 [Planctomycetes bacterium]|nr:hypothetical protein [Planctomycetota bacterium]
MNCFVASDETAIATRLGKLLTQHGHQCPASQILPLDRSLFALEAAQRDAPHANGGVAPVAAPPGSRSHEGQTDMVLVVFLPDPDRALATVRELSRRTTALVLAVGPVSDPKLLLRPLREGASEYLDIADLEDELSFALERLAATTRAGRILALVSPGGGSGASTLSANVSTLLAKAHGSCALVDLKLPVGDLASLLDLRPTYTIANLCQNAERLDKSLLRSCLVGNSHGVQLIAAPARISDARNVTAQGVGATLALAAQDFPYVVADVDHTFGEVQQRALQAADEIVLVLRLDFISVRYTHLALDFFKEIDVSSSRIKVIVNRHGQAGELSATQAEATLGIKFFDLLPDDPKTVNRANNNGVPVVLDAPTGKYSRRVQELMDKLERQWKSK